MENSNKITIIDPSEKLEAITIRLDRIIGLLENRGEKEENNSFNLLTNGDVEKILKISSSTLQNLRSSGKISFLQKGKKIYYTWDQVHNYLFTDFECE
jgi:hypothetical protein